MSVEKRASGMLLHISSLPSKYGIGDFGPQAYRFADFLKRAKQSYWQILPLNHTTPKTAHSPYNCFSAFAVNPLFISPELLYRRNFLIKSDITDAPALPQANVDYTRVESYKKKLFHIAYERFRDSVESSDFELFRAQNSSWLNDFAAFAALRHHFGGRLWSDWPRRIRDRNEKALKAMTSQLAEDINRQVFLQYIVYQQWFALKKYCNENGIQIIGDVPIYVALDSTDVWSHPQIFKLSRYKKPRYIAGVPPDYFSRTGQLWGNPVYDWQRLKHDGYRWWIDRIRHNLRLFDLVRIDHFRSFVAYWQVPAGHKTALHGKWIQGPKDDFFNELLRHITFAPIIAEDLGYITADVREMIGKFGFPCMKVLQFAFDGDFSSNPHILHNHTENCVVYTGTHDNNTARGWFSKEATSGQKRSLFDYLGHRIPANQIHWALARLAMSSVGKIAVIPMQDVLGLGAEARMNRPALSKGNWKWRLRPKQLTPALTKKLRDLSCLYGRD